MDQEQVIQRVRDYADAVRRKMSITKVILYGSYARGLAREDSDIDVAVVMNHIEGDFLDMEARLFRIGREIDLRIEPVLLEEGTDSSGFLADVMHHGRIVYSST